MRVCAACEPAKKQCIGRALEVLVGITSVLFDDAKMGMGVLKSSLETAGSARASSVCLWVLGGAQRRCDSWILVADTDIEDEAKCPQGL